MFVKSERIVGDGGGSLMKFVVSFGSGLLVSWAKLQYIISWIIMGKYHKTDKETNDNDLLWYS